MKQIFRQLTRGLENEIDKMPFGLSKEVLNRMTNKSLDRVIKKVGRKHGIADVVTKGVKDVFWHCQMSFPNFDDECYLELMQGMGGKLKPIAYFEEIDSEEKELLGFNNQILVNGKWGANYDRERGEMLGGYSEDGVTFHPDFRVTEIDEDNVPNALVLCSMMFETKGKIDMPYAELEAELNKCHSEAY